MNRKEIIEYLTPKFIEELDKITNMYKLIGISGDFAIKHNMGSGYDESPMWLQFAGCNDDMNAIVFKCSLSNIGFEIPLEEDDIMSLMYSGGGRHTEMYDYFKKLKYEHIRDNHPTVFNEQEHHLPRIKSFLNNYKGL